MAEMPSTPRLLYRGPPDERAETRAVANWIELEGALAEDWRLHRALTPATCVADETLIADLTDDPVVPEGSVEPSVRRRR